MPHHPALPPTQTPLKTKQNLVWGPRQCLGRTPAPGRAARAGAAEGRGRGAAAMDEEYDAIILGTGLKECIVSGLLAVAKKKVRAPAPRPMAGGRGLLLGLLMEDSEAGAARAWWGPPRPWSLVLELLLVLHGDVEPPLNPGGPGDAARQAVRVGPTPSEDGLLLLHGGRGEGGRAGWDRGQDSHLRTAASSQARARPPRSPDQPAKERAGGSPDLLLRGGVRGGGSAPRLRKSARHAPLQPCCAVAPPSPRRAKVATTAAKKPPLGVLGLHAGHVHGGAPRAAGPSPAGP